MGNKTKQDKRRKKKKMKNKNKMKKQEENKAKQAKGCYGFDVVRCMWCLCCVIQMQKTTNTHIHKKGWESIYRRGNSSTYLTNHANRGAIIDKEGGRGRKREEEEDGGAGGGRWWEIHHRHYCLFVSFLTIMHLFFHPPLLSPSSTISSH
jgi:hypothetical protein